MVKNLFIVLEGIDGSGKTTIGGKLSERLGCICYKTPSTPYLDIRMAVDQKCSWRARFLFYLSSVIQASSEIRELLKSNHVVCDRYLYSTLAYHYALDKTLAQINLDLFDILKPDFTFFLVASYQERAKRMAARAEQNPSNGIISLLDSEVLQSKVEEEFFGLDDLMRIPTDHRSIAEVVESILLELKPGLECKRMNSRYV